MKMYLSAVHRGARGGRQSSEEQGDDEPCKEGMMEILRLSRSDRQARHWFWSDSLAGGGPGRTVCWTEVLRRCFLSPRRNTVEMAHHSTFEVKLCAQKPTAIRPSTRSWPQVLLKCDRVDNLKQPPWVPYRRALLHEK